MATIKVIGTIVHCERENISKRLDTKRWMYRFDVEVERAEVDDDALEVPDRVRFICKGERLEHITGTPFAVGERVAFVGLASEAHTIPLSSAERL